MENFFFVYLNIEVSIILSTIPKFHLPIMPTSKVLLMKVLSHPIHNLCSALPYMGMRYIIASIRILPFFFQAVHRRAFRSRRRYGECLAGFIKNLKLGMAISFDINIFGKKYNPKYSSFVLLMEYF